MEKSKNIKFAHLSKITTNNKIHRHSKNQTFSHIISAFLTTGVRLYNMLKDGGIVTIRLFIVFRSIAQITFRNVCLLVELQCGGYLIEVMDGGIKITIGVIAGQSHIHLDGI